ncbi:insulinase family protein [Streptomyces rectiverticillatus]|uniref:M16 family metallopeptidase n=1 Tax=Streptomyces rectiverticillatus TaxID=173860 RepID=UPI0015C2D02C|nr:insulinase family protein [Streptomyces rectiverticillatus]QLE72812.1 insulinase family protein [Streptomyces rectiverticillatus]
MKRPSARSVLGNGLQVVVVEAPGAPLAEIRLVVPYALTDPREAPVRELLAARLGTGSTTRDRQAVADRTADLGAELSTVVTVEQLLLSVSVLSEGLEGTLELLGDLLVRPAYRDLPPAAAPAPRPAGPRTALRRAVLTHAFGPHPLAAEPSPPPSPSPLSPSPSPVTTDEVYALHRRAVVPAGSVLLVMTGAAPGHVLQLVTEHLGPWAGGPSGLTLPPFRRAEPTPGRLALHHPGAGQALLLTAGPAVPSTDPGHAALHLARLVLGGHSSSRLTQRLRERHALAYAVSADLRENAAGSWLEIECAGAPGTADRMAAEVTDVLRELADDGPTPRETERVRRYAAGFTRFALATRAEEASALAGFVARGMDVDWLPAYADVLGAVTRSQVADAAARFLKPSRTLTATIDDDQEGTSR